MHHDDIHPILKYPRTPHLRMLHIHFLQTFLQHFNALLQQATVGFQLRFTRPTQANGTTALALQVRPATHQPCGHMPQLC